MLFLCDNCMMLQMAGRAQGHGCEGGVAPGEAQVRSGIGSSSRWVPVCLSGLYSEVLILTRGLRTITTKTQRHKDEFFIAINQIQFFSPRYLLPHVEDQQNPYRCLLEGLRSYLHLIYCLQISLSKASYLTCTSSFRNYLSSCSSAPDSTLR